ncbi:MAG: DUF4340 domain-containing protein [Verrucomicrobia bacterium]|nr:MAG: DUF4340 domain-containing protein [Verrucomicrobiota bacterium]
MRTKVTLFLLVLVVGLGAIAYYYNRQWDARRAYAAGRVHLLGPDAEDLDYLEIAFRDPASSVVLEQGANGWELIDPVRWPANYFAVNRLLTQLQFLERETSFPVDSLAESGQTLADFGLDPAEGRLTYGRRGERRSLLIGRITDVGNRLYVMPEDGDRVYVVAQSLLDSLRLSLEEFRSGAVFYLPLFEIKSWSIQLAEAGNLRIWISRDGDRWKLETPVLARADDAAVETLVNRILSLKVASLEPAAADLNLLGLTSPAFTVTFQGNGRRESLLIGAPVPGAESPTLHYAKRDDNPTVFTADIDFLDELRNAQIGLRDRHLLDFDPTRLQSIAILPAGRPAITLQRLETGRWQVVSRSPERGLLTLPADEAIIQRLIDELADLQAIPERGFVSDAPSAIDLENYGLTGPSWQIVLTERDAQNSATRSQTLQLGAAESRESHTVYARVSESPSVYLVDRALADDLHPEPHRYRDRQLQKLPEGARIASLSLKRLSTDETMWSYAIADTSQPWNEALAEVPPAERQALLALVAQLRNLRARDILAAEFRPTVPGSVVETPWTWLLESSIKLEGGQGEQVSTFRLYLEDFRGGTSLTAGAPDLHLMFTTEQPFLDAFSTLVLHRPEPQPPAPSPDPTVPQPAGPQTDPDPAPAEAEPAADAAPAQDPASDSATPPATPASDPAPPSDG